jgi:archaellum biogenesis protein FlaJ (TadC family)
MYLSLDIILGIILIIAGVLMILLAVDNNPFWKPSKIEILRDRMLFIFAIILITFGLLLIFIL